MKRLSSAIAAIALIGTPAFAADMAVKAKPRPPVVTPAYNWSGFYIGANVGGGWSSSRSVSYVPNDEAILEVFESGGAASPVSFKSSGAVGGLQLGYNWQFNRNWLFGFETDFDWSGLKGSASSGNVFGGAIPVSATADEHIRWFGTVRGRIGWIPIDNLLTYFTGGFAYGRVEHSGNYVNNGIFVLNNETNVVGFLCVPGATCFSGSSNRVMTGWTIGGGLEYGFWQRWSVKAEYLYVNLESDSFTETATNPFPGLALSSYNANFSRTNFNVVRVGLNYQFH